MSCCDEIKKLGKGIGNEARYRILETLMNGPESVGEIVKKIKLSQPAVSQHLKVLKESNLVTDTKKGLEVVYTINVEYTINVLKGFIDSLQCKKSTSK